MWVLVVLGAVYGTDEVKVTYYDAYQTQIECYEKLKKLKAEFKMNEEAICVGQPPKKPLKNIKRLDILENESK